jgi:hypothetical protein
LITIVKRVAQLTGEKPLDLRLVWEQEVERALRRNNGVFNSRSYMFAARAFLERAGVQLDPEFVMTSKKSGRGYANS